MKPSRLGSVALVEGGIKWRLVGRAACTLASFSKKLAQTSSTNKGMIDLDSNAKARNLKIYGQKLKNVELYSVLLSQPLSMAGGDRRHGSYIKGGYKMGSLSSLNYFFTNFSS